MAEGSGNRVSTRLAFGLSVQGIRTDAERLVEGHDRLACQVCHVPAIARKISTKTEWYWDTAGDMSRVPQDVGDGRFDYDKKKGAAGKAASEKPEDFEFFEGADAGSGEQFMAVRPYEGAIEEPDEHPEENDSPPDVEYELEHVYGYRCEDSR